MSTQVIFYALSKKFLDEQDKPKGSVPEKAQQVMYYSLSIGHHVGVIDCLKKILVCPLDDYKRWIAQLPEGEAQRKMAGLMKFGEIMIDSSHTKLLGYAFGSLSVEHDGLKQGSLKQDNLKKGNLKKDSYAQWTQTLLDYLAAIEQETALYLMVRRLDD